MVTRPVELTRGITLRMTPVSRYWIELTIDPVNSLWADCVVTGISSPTLRIAGWLSTTHTEGEETTFTWVTSDRASITTFGSASLPMMRFRPMVLGEIGADAPSGVSEVEA